MPGSLDTVPLDSIAHVIQMALTPVFLLSGIGTLLNVFNTRLARVSDISRIPPTSWPQTRKARTHD